MPFIALRPKLPKQDGDFDTLLTELNTVTIRRSRRVLPAEWAAQSGVWLTWPHEDTDWADMLEEVTETYIRLAYEIARRERLLIVHPRADEVETLLRKRLPKPVCDNIIFFSAPTNDTWTRDHGVLSVTGPAGWELVDCAFNGWGGKFPATLDNALTRHLYDAGILKGTYIDALDFVLEGGSIESDGAGTLLTTEQCLCTATRGEDRSRTAVEARLRELFGAQRVLWLSNGHLEGDDTDGHIDTLARFCPGGVIAYVKCDDTTDPHFDSLRLMEQELQSLRDAESRPYPLMPLPMAPACFDPTDGHRLPATYANFLCLPTAVIYPTYGDAQKDNEARHALAKLFPKFDLIDIDARPLIRQHGSIHCAAMQLPRGVLA
ncbi:MAG: agmatine deiminase family protein [Bacteroidaceae bacterium]|nr:agmatine deiminase family protein [Bacteroidaceae bacterium]